MPPRQQTQMHLLHHPHRCARGTPLRVLRQTGILPMALATPRSPPDRTQSEVEQQRACHPSLAAGAVYTRISMHMSAPYRKREIERERESEREKKEEERERDKKSECVSECVCVRERQ